MAAVEQRAPWSPAHGDPSGQGGAPKPQLVRCVFSSQQQPRSPKARSLLALNGLATRCGSMAVGHFFFSPTHLPSPLQIPACDFGQQASCGPPQLPANTTQQSGTLQWGNQTIPYYGGQKVSAELARVLLSSHLCLVEWIDFIRCGVVLSGEAPHETWANNTRGPPGGLLCGSQTQFPEPVPGVSGFVHNATMPIDAINIVDRVVVPSHIAPGRYLLSWRWDCEQSPQVWQNCADIVVV